VTEISEATIRDLTAAIDRLCDVIGGRRQERVLIKRAKRPGKDRTGAERQRRYRDRLQYRAKNGGGSPESIGIVPID
jgi:hypothetical protein